MQLVGVSIEYTSLDKTVLSLQQRHLFLLHQPWQQCTNLRFQEKCYHLLQATRGNQSSVTYTTSIRIRGGIQEWSVLMKHRSLLLWSEVLLTTPPCPHLFVKSVNWPWIHRRLLLSRWFPHMSRVEQSMNLGVQVGGWSSNIQSCLCCLAQSITTARDASWDISLFNGKKSIFQ